MEGWVHSEVTTESRVGMENRVHSEVIKESRVRMENRVHSEVIKESRVGMEKRVHSEVMKGVLGKPVERWTMAERSPRIVLDSCIAEKS
jgi:hypothetical protein